MPAPAAFSQTGKRPSVTPEAEFRSRLSWFLAVSDQRALDPGALTYEPAFGLREKPFSLSSDPRFFFTRSAHGAAFGTLAAGIRRREGILVLTGEVGTGKTTLCRAVLQSLDQKTFAAFVADPFLSREDLLKTLLVDFGVVSVDEVRRGLLRGATRADLCYPLYDFLASLQPLKAFAVVMIDEAQNLTPELLEEIRILSDLENRQKLLEVFLIGQPELEARLAAPSMRQLTQRVAVRCELPPLTVSEVGAYISHRLTVAGNDGRVRFTDTATELVYAASTGIPRVVNLVCDRALTRAARMQTTRVDADHVAWGVNDLKIPVPETPKISLVPRQTDSNGQSAAAQSSEPPAHSSPSDVADALPPPDSLVQTLAGLMVDPQPQAFTESPELPAVPASKPAERAPFDNAEKVSATILPEPEFSLSDFKPETLAEPGESTVPVHVRTSKHWLAVGGVALALAGTLIGYRFWTTTPAAATSSAIVQPAAAPAPPPPVEAPVEQRPAAQPQEQLAILMATFQSEERTARSLRELRDAGFAAFSMDVSLREGARGRAVFLGPYGGPEEADRDLARARQIAGYDGGRIVSVKPPLVDSKDPRQQ